MDSVTLSLDAEEIAEDLLYRTGKPISCGDYHGIEECFILPQTVETLEGMRVLRGKADLWAIFETVRNYYREHGVVNCARTILDAKFRTDRLIDSIHVTRLMRAGGELFRAPFPVYSTLRLDDDGKWRIKQSNYAILDSRAHSKALLT